MAYDDYLSQHGRKFGITRSNPTRVVLDGAVQPLAGTDPVALPTFTVATAPAAASFAASLIYVSDGAAGSPIVAYSDGANWKRVDTGATIAAA
ncbi:hypothetical protein [Xanthobacter sp. 126]|uniref:hypothetical protein n=1 Tax=Xanthobacter sp. 126 TaxID=1131814 RepID=UPI00045EC259|nr:hypothetical protein [Xanthobacter sp. 126]